MYSILCYGDSNTWGYEAETAKRFPRDLRWTGVLQELLGPDYYIIEEGLCGRTAASSTPVEPEVNGLLTLPALLPSHAPLDLLVLMLGINDFQLRYGNTPMDVARGVEKLVQLVQNPHSHGFGTVPEILLIAPPPVGEGVRRFVLRDLFGGEACMEKSRQLSPLIRGVAQAYGCRFLDAGEIVRPGDRDGLHLDRENHRKLAEAIFQMVKEQN